MIFNVKIEQSVLSISEISAKQNLAINNQGRGAPYKKGGVRQKIQKSISGAGLLFGTGAYSFQTFS